MNGSGIELVPRWIVSEEDYQIQYDLDGPKPFGAPDPEQIKLEQEAKGLRVEIAPFSKKCEIPQEKLDNSLRDDSFDHFVVESGMNINVPQGKIKTLRVSLNLFADGNQSEDAYAVDGFPNDKIVTKSIVKGKIQLHVNKLLKIIPDPIAQAASELLDISLEPWEIDWKYDKLTVGFSEGLTNKLDWYLSSENVNQSFKCYIILRKKKDVKVVSAKAQAIFGYKSPSKGLGDWFKKRFDNDTIWSKTPEQEIPIINPK